MNICKIIKILTLALAVLMGGEGCKSTNHTGSAVMDSSSSTVPGGDSASDMKGFLETPYKPLNDWMGERFNVNYQAMTLELIFDQVPINDIHYQKSNLPSGAPAFYFESPDITRRQLLRKIAQHWNLSMEYINGADGNPTAVRVTGRG